ncbi:TonB-dependent siderophore receptor [Ulvibacterium sp.]|uniref:TonB-dependent receptor plug domain-containing protein n=1 Tax=Ulvibacterium sp. TaxID=2665914 RepID=UPI002607877E|nr:TonB-dependent receptor plug domain-containing protein [Ulvibacterium sp.]
MKTYFFVVAVTCFVTVAKSQDSLKVVQLDDVVVTGNKIETPIEKSGKTIFKLNQKAIEANRGKDVMDLLNEIPGVQIDGNFATPGTNISYRVRGAQSEQTLILIDGIPFNDPSGLAQTFDLRMLDLNQIASIEVLKGGLSSLYGTGAAAGVINIKLKESAKETFKTILNMEYGSFNTFTSNVNVSGKADKFNYMVSGSYRSSDGFSAALDTLGTQDFDDDGIKSLNFLTRLGYQFNERFSLGFLAAYDDVASDFDGGAFRDDDSELDQKLLKFALSPRYQWNSGSLKGNISYHTNERIFNSPNRSNPDERDISEFNGNTLQADVILDQVLSNEIRLIGGINFQRPVWDPEDADSESFTMIDPYASLIYDHANFNVQLGGRLNNHSLYGTNFVWNVNPNYVFNLGQSKLKILGSYATAFLSPSLSQLYAGDFGFLIADAGNPDLEPQESETVEGGFEWFSNEKFRFGGVYFYRKDKDFIDFVFNDDFTEGTYVNLEDETEVGGVELNASYAFLPQLTLAGHYTYTKSLTDDVILRRVPNTKFGFTLSAIPVEKLLVKLTHLHVGEVPENNEITLDAYDLFDGFVSYSFKKLTVSGGINNIFDAEYVDRFGWATAERNYNIGLRYTF